MHRAAQRPHVAAGIALMGAGLIALTPVVAPKLVHGQLLAEPNVKVADVLLTANDEDLANDLAALFGIVPNDLTSPDLNIAISVDGVTLLHEGSAAANSGSGDIAIANFDSATIFNLTGNSGGSALAQYGNGNDTLVFGDSQAQAGGSGLDALGNNDIATVFGNLDHLYSGAGILDGTGSFDLAAVFGDSINSAGATGANWLVEILPTLF